MVSCTDLSLRYDELFAIKNINISIKKNTTCAIIGKSGCGKTTLLHAIAGLKKLDSGIVRINNETLTGIRKSTGFILQNDSLFPWKTIYDNVALGLIVRDKNKSQIEELVIDILKELDLLDHKDKYPNQLSGGQRQKVAIARSIAIKPDLLLMDEPTASLDEITKESFQKLLLKLLKQHHMTVVFVTHDIEEAVYLADSIIIMEDGKIKTTIENSLGIEEKSRDNLEFYKMCLSVRASLGESI